MSFQSKLGEALKNVIESKGEAGAVEIVRQALESKKMVPEDFSIREIWEACNGPIASRRAIEAVSSGAFPTLTGEVINSRIIGAYNAVATIGDSLVQTVPSNMQVIVTGKQLY